MLPTCYKTCITEVERGGNYSKDRNMTMEELRPKREELLRTL